MKTQLIWILFYADQIKIIFKNSTARKRQLNEEWKILNGKYHPNICCLCKINMQIRKMTQVGVLCYPSSAVWSGDDDKIRKEVI